MREKERPFEPLAVLEGVQDFQLRDGQIDIARGASVELHEYEPPVVEIDPDCSVIGHDGNSADDRTGNLHEDVHGIAPRPRSRIAREKIILLRIDRDMDGRRLPLPLRARMSGPPG